jgi:cytochrome c553
VKKLLVSLVVVALSSGAVLGFSAATLGPKHNIKEVMKEAHKDKLVNKVQDGQATKEEKEKLLGLYISLYDNKPTKGDQASWNDKSGALVVAAAKALLGQDGAADALKNAANCGACHKVHK